VNNFHGEPVPDGVGFSIRHLQHIHFQGTDALGKTFDYEFIKESSSCGLACGHDEHLISGDAPAFAVELPTDNRSWRQADLDCDLPIGVTGEKGVTVGLSRAGTNYRSPINGNRSNQNRHAGLRPYLIGQVISFYLLALSLFTP
jgi:hypothetical protein